MVSNIANRNISLILAVSSCAGLVFCIYSTIIKGTRWTELCSIATSTAIFAKLYLCYRREVKNGNIYGKVNPFRKTVR